jgi:hypothetical protein
MPTCSELCTWSEVQAISHQLRLTSEPAPCNRQASQSGSQFRTAEPVPGSCEPTALHLVLKTCDLHRHCVTLAAKSKITHAGNHNSTNRPESNCVTPGRRALRVNHVLPSADVPAETMPTATAAPTTRSTAKLFIGKPADCRGKIF